VPTRKMLYTIILVVDSKITRAYTRTNLPDSLDIARRMILSKTETDCDIDALVASLKQTGHYHVNPTTFVGILTEETSRRFRDTVDS